MLLVPLVAAGGRMGVVVLSLVAADGVGGVAGVEKLPWLPDVGLLLLALLVAAGCCTLPCFCRVVIKSCPAAFWSC